MLKTLESINRFVIGFIEFLIVFPAMVAATLLKNPFVHLDLYLVIRQYKNTEGFLLVSEPEIFGIDPCVLFVPCDKKAEADLADIIGDAYRKRFYGYVVHGLPAHDVPNEYCEKMIEKGNICREMLNFHKRNDFFFGVKL